MKKTIVVYVTILFIGTAIAPGVIAQTLKQKSVETTQGDFYDLLILAPKVFEKDLRPLVCHKNNMGMKTRLETLDEVYKQMYWHGRDCAEKIKYYIKYAFDNWGIKYVLLVGGRRGQTFDWYFPVRYSNMNEGYESEILSDLYFADIYDSQMQFSSWDSDNDGIYSEWDAKGDPEDTYIDLKPDIAVGRLACRNNLEVKIMAEKIINYEKPCSCGCRFNEFLAIAGDTYIDGQYPFPTPEYEGEYYADLAIENMTGFNATRLYTSNGLTGPKQIIKAFNKGWGFVYFVGHGNPVVWATHFPNDKNRTDPFKLQHIMMLRNKCKQPVTVVSGCHNLQFDVTLSNIFKLLKENGLADGIKKILYSGIGAPYCFGWLLTKRKQGGSISTLGCTALGFTKEDKTTIKGGINELEVEFFHQYGQEQVDILGDTWKNAISWYVETYPVDWENPSPDGWIDSQVVQTWILLGDPSLKIGGY